MSYENVRQCTDHDDSIIEAMARVFFMVAIAEQIEDLGYSLSQKEIADVIPASYDPNAYNAARQLAYDTVLSNKSDNGKIIPLDILAGNNDLDSFGHYLTMESLGCGVGLDDLNEPITITVPYCYFDYSSLSEDYEDFIHNLFGQPEETEE